GWRGRGAGVGGWWGWRAAWLGGTGRSWPKGLPRPAGSPLTWPGARSPRKSRNGSAPAGAATSCAVPKEGRARRHGYAKGMADPQEVLAERVSAAVVAAFGASHAGADPLIRPSQFADFQANVALPLGKSLGVPPRQAAGQIVAHLDVAGICDRVEVSGPGFINLTLADRWVATQASGLLTDERLGVALADPGMKVV